MGKKGIYNNEGDIYEGQFENNLANGKGTFKFATGEVYEGNFVNDNFEGEGTFTSPKSGNKYVGQWVNGVRCGQGKSYINDRLVYEVCIVSFHSFLCLISFFSRTGRVQR